MCLKLKKNFNGWAVLASGGAAWRPTLKSAANDCQPSDHCPKRTKDKRRWRRFRRTGYFNDGWTTPLGPMASSITPRCLFSSFFLLALTSLTSLHFFPTVPALLLFSSLHSVYSFSLHSFANISSCPFNRKNQKLWTHFPLPSISITSISISNFNGFIFDAYWSDQSLALLFSDQSQSLDSIKADHWNSEFHGWWNGIVFRLDLNNARSLQLIETSCMIVCIDEPLPAELFNRRENAPGQSDTITVGRRDDTNRAVQMINGGGSKFNSANRWFDKSVQVNSTIQLSWYYYIIITLMLHDDYHILLVTFTLHYCITWPLIWPWFNLS